eukprot:128450_1
MHHLKPLNVLFPRIGGGLSMARVIVMESLFLICIATHFTIYTKHNCSVFRWVWVFEIDFFSEFDLSRSSVQLDWQKSNFIKQWLVAKQCHIILSVLDSNHDACDQMAFKLRSRLEDDTKLLIDGNWKIKYM